MSAPNASHPVVQKMDQSFFQFTTNEGREKAISFVPRSTDVIVVTPAKCGTTWMQQIMHQLRSGGDMTFEDIDDVVPWIMLAHDLGQDLDAEHKISTQMFQVSQWISTLP